MGYYVNPTNMSKEEFLEKYGVKVSLFSIKWDEVPIMYFPVVWVDNGDFTAVGIAYDEKELERFRQPTDPRPKQAFFVSIEKLKEVSDIENYFNRYKS